MQSSWFKVWVSLRNHPKTLYLNVLLGVERSYHLVEDVWAYATEHYPDGDISGVPPEVLAVVAGYPDGVRLREALVTAQFLSAEGHLINWGVRQKVDVLRAMAGDAPARSRAKGPPSTSSERATKSRKKAEAARKAQEERMLALEQQLLAAQVALTKALRGAPASSADSPPDAAAASAAENAASADAALCSGEANKIGERETAPVCSASSALAAPVQQRTQQPPLQPMTDAEWIDTLKLVPPPMTFDELMISTGRLKDTFLEDLMEENGITREYAEQLAHESYRYGTETRVIRGEPPWDWGSGQLPLRVRQQVREFVMSGARPGVRAAEEPAKPAAQPRPVIPGGIVHAPELDAEEGLALLRRAGFGDRQAIDAAIALNAQAALERAGAAA
jgi:hypothetical protein